MSAEPIVAPVATSMARLGDAHGVLLAGPVGAEDYASHHHRLGPLPRVTDGLLDLLTASDLRGRGGGGFPFARKVSTVQRASRRSEPIVVVNGAEGEPASRKDALLLTTRPHLVLDGAAATARLLGASTAVIHVHASSPTVESVRRAITERWAEAPHDPQWVVSTGPGRYVASESSAVISHLEGGHALPRWSAVPAAEAGYRGRPTLLSNAETFAHVAVIARDLPWPSPFLVTVRGPSAPVVVEVVGSATLGDLLREYGGLWSPPSAVLLGGYAGTWVDGATSWHLPLEPHGCGLVAALPEGACGLAETARLARWLSDQGAGQCGPCFLGLPRLADALDDLVRGRRGARDEVEQMVRAVDGRGACSHPDGVARLVRSALTTFGHQLHRHRKLHRRHCVVAGFPLSEERS
jgi:NADH:ubiquinone oxidoreductase subunit F (NADH-binding)